jgi:hypothetical protein
MVEVIIDGGFPELVIVLLTPLRTRLPALSCHGSDSAFSLLMS